MRGKLMFLAGVGVGYVLGTRAGRERYEQLVGAFRKVRDHPTVQEAAGLVQAQTTRLVDASKDFAEDRLRNTRVGDRMLGDRTASTTTTSVPPPAM